MAPQQSKMTSTSLNPWDGGTPSTSNSTRTPTVDQGSGALKDANRGAKYPQSEKRKAQYRAASNSFRERKGKRAQQIRVDLAQADNLNTELQNRITHLQSEREILRQSVSPEILIQAGERFTEHAPLGPTEQCSNENERTSDALARALQKQARCANGKPMISQEEVMKVWNSIPERAWAKQGGHKISEHGQRDTDLGK
ncbi:hypothetical protein CROQUDRAFT_718002 [Cronartium quercuum f. sp. fusiforme G11]|uniref:BZIP domain-containing protein n=1 Tax=Cronartium quercuum f. sp. fusiforme G11 TaxID=708437 RepID=A0A9P6N8B6_9BASI|nr:hypothetical protein CROQUDRAFT_718002 [Cronartium quercuum f. sp. fusiforme G11]